mgnify:CR=1 FL=1
MFTSISMALHLQFEGISTIFDPKSRNHLVVEQIETKIKQLKSTAQRSKIMSKPLKLIIKSLICTAVFVLIPAFSISLNTQVSGEDVWKAVMANAETVLKASPENYRINAVDRLFSIEQYGTMEKVDSSRLLPLRVETQKGLNVDYILLAFGIIGFIAIRRRPNL